MMQKHTTAYHVFMTFLLLLGILTAYGVSQLLKGTPLEDWTWLVDAPSAIAVFSFLNWQVFGKYLWHFRFMRLIGIVEVPDLRGRWEGILVSSHDHQEHACVFEIEQCAYSISVWAYFRQSASTPIIAGFTNISGRQYLYFTYDNDTGAMSEAGMEPHKGTMRLEFYNKELKGSYFNSRGNKGDVTLHRTGDGLLHCFQSA